MSLVKTPKGLGRVVGDSYITRSTEDGMSTKPIRKIKVLMLKDDMSPKLILNEEEDIRLFSPSELIPAGVI